jgi:PAS domain S-box-containing protein
MRNFALRTAIVYFIIGAAWILFSDKLLSTVVSLPDRPFVGTVKGLGFVFLTAVTLFFLLQRYLKRLRTNETQYRALFRSHPQPLWVYDTKTLKFLAVNNATVKKYGYSLEEFSAMTMLDIRPETERDRMKDFLTKVEKAEFIADTIHLHKAKNGREFYTRTSSHATIFDGKPARMVMAIDADAEKEAERKMNVSETKLNSLLNSSDDVIWLFDNEGSIITYNEAFKKKFEQVLKTAVPGNGPFKLDGLKNNPIIERWLKNLKLAMQGQHLRVEEGFINHDKNEEEFFEIIMSPIYDGDKNLIGVGCIARDITERIISQQEIEERINQLKEIAWIQSHTVRRPLANIMGLVELIKLNSSDQEQIAESVDLLEKSCRELDDIIREVVKKAGNVK